MDESDIGVDGSTLPVLAEVVRVPRRRLAFLLEYFTDLPAGERATELEAEALQIWEQFRPHAEAAAYKTAGIAVSVRPTSPAL